MGYLDVSATVSQRSMRASRSISADALAAAPEAMALMVCVESARLLRYFGLILPLDMRYGFLVAFFKKSGQDAAVDHIFETDWRVW